MENKMETTMLGLCIIEQQPATLQTGVLAHSVLPFSHVHQSACCSLQPACFGGCVLSQLLGYNFSMSSAWRQSTKLISASICQADVACEFFTQQAFDCSGSRLVIGSLCKTRTCHENETEFWVCHRHMMYDLETSLQQKLAGNLAILQRINF